MTTARLRNLQKLQKAQQGFTLIELLVVIGILAVLLSIVLIAINPARQFAQSNNTKRASDVNAILNAIHEYAADNHGSLPAGMPAPGGAAAAIASGSLPADADICSALVTQYIAALPADPKTNNGTAVDKPGCTAAGGYATGYTVSVSSSDNRITVSAPATELSIPAITVTR